MVEVVPPVVHESLTNRVMVCRSIGDGPYRDGIEPVKVGNRSDFSPNLFEWSIKVSSLVEVTRITSGVDFQVEGMTRGNASMKRREDRAVGHEYLEKFLSNPTEFPR